MTAGAWVDQQQLSMCCMANYNLLHYVMLSMLPYIHDVGGQR